MNDPMEMKNEYDNPEYAVVVDSMKQALADLRVKYKDSKELDQMYLNKYLELVE